MRTAPRSLAAGALIALTVAGCGAGADAGIGASARPAGGMHAPMRARMAASSAALPAGWTQLRLRSGSVLPYPPGWRAVSGDPGTASAALLDRAGKIRAYLNATPATSQETLVGWGRFRVRHNAAEGDRNVRLITAQGGARIGTARASCVTDGYATSRSSYRELACVLAPANGRQATVLVGAAQPSEWTHQRPLLEFAINHFTG